MRGLCLVMVLALLAGCGVTETYNNSKKEDRYQSQLLGYEKAIRWGDYDSAYAMLSDYKAGEELPNRALLEKTKVSSYRVRSQIPAKDGLSVVLVVEIEYFNVDTQVVRRLTDRQAWRYLEEDSRWVLEGQLPNFQ